jgi:hypothetical protein
MGAETKNEKRPIELLRVERITQRQSLDAKRLNDGETATIPVDAIVKTLQADCQPVGEIGHDIRGAGHGRRRACFQHRSYFDDSRKRRTEP